MRISSVFGYGNKLYSIYFYKTLKFINFCIFYCSRLKCKTPEESKENVYEFEDYKIKRRLEKLELKKVKLLEKSVIRNTSCMPPHLESGTAWPRITSGIAARCSLLQKVTAGKSFVEVWVIINDGTVPWNNVSFIVME